MLPPKNDAPVLYILYCLHHGPRPCYNLISVKFCSIFETNNYIPQGQSMAWVHPTTSMVHWFPTSPTGHLSWT